MAEIRVTAKTVKDLEASIRPTTGLEFYPQVLYDTQTYTSGTTVGPVNYFATIQADKTLGNMEGASQLPEGQYFEVHRLFCDIFTPPFGSATAITAVQRLGSINDIFILVMGAGRGMWQATYQNKIYGPVPLSFLQASGGPGGAPVAWGTGTAPVEVEFATNGNIASGGYFMGGRLIYRPKSTFFHSLTWAAAQTLAAGNTNIRLCQQGVLYRPVL